MKKIINADFLKYENRKRILNLLYKKELSRTELSKLTGLTKAAVSIITDELLKCDLIIEGSKKDSTGGRKSTELKLNDNLYGIGTVYFDRDFYEVGIMKINGEIINSNRGSIIKENSIESINNIKNDLKALVNKSNLKIIYISIACPGPMDKEKGILKNISNFNGFNNLNIKEIFNKEFNIPVYIDNISNALAKAEYIKNNDLLNKYLELVIDSGFGSSLAKIKDTIEIEESELGHTTINIFGNRCSCGNIGCAELYINKYNYLINHKEFIVSLSAVIINAINAFSIEEVVIYSNDIDDFDNLINEINKEIKNKVNYDIKIIKSVLDKEYSFISGNLVINNVIDLLIKTI